MSNHLFLFYSYLSKKPRMFAADIIPTFRLTVNINIKVCKLQAMQLTIHEEL